MTAWLVVCYLSAAAAANLLVAQFGQAALPVTAFVLVPFDLVARDLLHNRWHGVHLWARMAALIAAGSLLSLALNWNAWPVAMASCAAFCVSGTCNAAVYAAMAHRTCLLRVNTSNCAGALADSIVFPLVAFGAVDVALCAGQWLSKFGGGLLWSLLLRRLFR